MKHSRRGGKNLFEIGGEEFFFDGASGSPRVAKTLEDIHIRLGTLLKSETVSLLLGAGASVNCGGQLIGKIPLPIEKDLIEQGTEKGGAMIQPWLRVFYLAARCFDNSNAENDDDILSRRDGLRNKKRNIAPLNANFEKVLTTLHHWRLALLNEGNRLHVGNGPQVSVEKVDLDTCIDKATRALARVCELPSRDEEEHPSRSEEEFLSRSEKKGTKTHENLVRKLLTRPLNLKRVNIFTLNYDTLVEQATDAIGAVLLDGFVGTQRRIFRPESYEQDLYFPAETTEGGVHRLDRVLHLYKLHGSITWTASEPEINNPYGIQSETFELEGKSPLLIYPIPAKHFEVLGFPYSELFRRFANSLIRPQSVLFVVGYGFGDEHVNAIIRQALAVPSFTLVIVDPSATSDFVAKLRAQKDSRILIATGPEFGTLEGFVDKLLPDLHDEKIRKKVSETYKALMRDST